MHLVSITTTDMSVRYRRYAVTKLTHDVATERGQDELTRAEVEQFRATGELPA